MHNFVVYLVFREVKFRTFFYRLSPRGQNTQFRENNHFLQCITNTHA